MFSTPMAAKRFPTVPVDSSAASNPLPWAARAQAVLASSSRKLSSVIVSGAADRRATRLLPLARQGRRPCQRHPAPEGASPEADSECCHGPHPLRLPQLHLCGVPRRGRGEEQPRLLL
ncbi:protein of unknown function [Cyanobium sp. NIES-981]|nr:protein of unknown function [Cyanobium sp. NIES-981]